MTDATPVVDRRALLLTDVVDSTQLVRELGDRRAAEVWARHDTLARALLAPHDGLEIDKTDGFLLIFEQASNAVRYALAYHAALAEVSAELGVPLAARAGLHVGDVILRRNPPEQVARGAKPLEVEGLAKPTAARVMSVASARQTLLTAEARAALDPADLTIVSHGHWRMKGLDEPLELFEVGPEDAPFTPPPDGAKVYRVVRDGGGWLPVREVPNDLGPPPDAFFGRQRELRELARALEGGASLVTVTGAAGIGKARMARRYGRTRLGDWPGGVWQVDARQGVTGAWRERCLVLVTHADRAAPDDLAALRAASPDATFVVTRRDRLDLPGERAIPLGPLDPDAAVALFEARSRAVDPDARTERAHAAAVVEQLEFNPRDVEQAAALCRAPGRGRPFLGLRSFAAEDAERFFGRDAEALSLALRVRRDRLVTVTGASGSGKTSLLQAGVRRHLPEFDIGVIRPGPQPLEALLTFLEHAAPQCKSAIYAAVEAGESTLDPASGPPPGPGRPLLLVVDQAEEMLTLTADPSARDAFGVALVAFAALPDAHVALAVREDFFARIAEVGSLKGRYHLSLEVLSRPDRASLLQTLVKPAAQFGHRFEPGLAEQMVDEVSREPAALALLQFCADQLWDRRDSSRLLLTRAAYEAVGGVTGALTVHADKIVSALAPAERGEARRQFLRLITQQVTKEPRARKELLESATDTERARRVLDSLVRARLLTAFEADDGTTMVEIVHEALLRHWQQLTDWLGEDEEGQRMARSLGHAAEEWDRRGRSRDLLWRGSPLYQMAAWRERTAPHLTSLEKAFADTSVSVARTRRRALWAGFTLSALVLMAIAVGSLLLWRRAEVARVAADAAAEQAVAEGNKARAAERDAQLERARAEQKQAEALESSAAALAARSEADLQRAAAEKEAENARLQESLARDAQTAAEEQRGKAERSARAIIDAQRLFAVSELSGDPARAAPFLADVDPTTQPERWRAAAWELLQRPLTLASTRVAASNGRTPFAVSPEGGLLAIADGTRLVAWDSLRGTSEVIGAEGGTIQAVAWSPNGEWIASSRFDGTVRLYRRQGAGWSTPRALVGHGRPPEALAFSENGRRLVSASPDGTARVWPTDGGGAPGVLTHSGAVWMARFIEDDTQVLTVSADGTVATWDVDLHSQQWSTRGLGAADAVATAAAYEPGTGRIAAAWSDRSLQLFDGETHASASLDGSPSFVVEARFVGPAGAQLLTRGQEGELSSWSRGADGGWKRRAFPLPMARCRDIDLSADGRWLAAVGTDGGAVLYELGRDGLPVDQAMLVGHDRSLDVIGVAFDAEGSRVLTLGADGAVRVWPVRGSGMSRRVEDLDGADVQALSYTSDGSLEVVLRDGGQRAVASDARPSPSPTIKAVELETDSFGAVHILQGEGQPIPLLGHFGAVKASAALGDVQVATAADDGTVRLWNLPDDDALLDRLRDLPIGCARTSDLQRYLAADAATASQCDHQR